MKDDLEHAVRQVADLMQVDLSAAELERVVEKSGFEYMKSLNHKFAPPIPGFGRDNRRALMMRSGKKNSSSEYLSEERRAHLDEVFQGATQGKGFGFSLRCSLRSTLGTDRQS